MSPRCSTNWRKHLEDRYEELLQSGLSAADAEQIAVEPLNTGPSLVEALSRARHRPAPQPPSRPNHLANLLYDLRIALRGMRQKPAFSLLVVGMLALGIAGNAAIFSTVNSLFLKPLPFPDSSRLIDLNETAPRWNLKYVSISEPDLFAWRKHNSTFDGMAFFDNPDFNLSKIGPAQHISGAKVTRDMLDVGECHSRAARRGTRSDDGAANRIAFTRATCGVTILLSVRHRTHIIVVHNLDILYEQAAIQIIPAFRVLPAGVCPGGSRLAQRHRYRCQRRPGAGGES